MLLFPTQNRRVPIQKTRRRKKRVNTQEPTQTWVLYTEIKIQTITNPLQIIILYLPIKPKAVVTAKLIVAAFQHLVVGAFPMNIMVS